MHSDNFNYKEIIALYKNGNSVKDIAKLYNCGASTMFRYFKKKKIKTRRRGEWLIKYNIPLDDILKLYRKGYTIKQISKRYKVNPNVIYSLTRDIKILRKEHKKIYWNNLNRELKCMLKLYKHGHTINEIAKKYKIDTRYISKLFRKNKIKIKKQGDFYYNKYYNIRKYGKHISYKELYNLYCIKKMSAHEIMLHTGLSKSNIECSIRRYKIKKRTLYECQEYSTAKMVKTKYQKGIYRNTRIKNASYKYLLEVQKCSRKSIKLLFSKEILNAMKEYHWQIDHVYSVKAGFINNVPPQIIGCPYNLRAMRRLENIKKGAKCDITLKKLINIYNKKIKGYDNEKEYLFF